MRTLPPLSLLANSLAHRILPITPVLSLSGRCTIGSIVEVMRLGLGVKMSEGYVHSILEKARGQATAALTSLARVLPFSGAIAIDEVFLREWENGFMGWLWLPPSLG